jgi:hypothetical protein
MNQCGHFLEALWRVGPVLQIKKHGREEINVATSHRNRRCIKRSLTLEAQLGRAGRSLDGVYNPA